ncbi:ABC-F family ATP-binding cassette domain-containing protein [Bacteroidales bacterium OttesenSCG-928-K22]|nr:ABC-F family ATP-binding cassette domain-containing protein [Bacteroidales bacterium OttesenSCG-928-L14]MDL2241143.1 ABC-F family ATP-binding cassette domain-containing protein [Bacteroidales bacterium OttesenSCG-928-K22]
MLAINNLSHHYTGEDLFFDISLHFHKGERVGVVGKNGCGKTTMLNIIAGFLSPEKGNISYPSDYKIGFLQQSMQTLKNDSLINETKLAVPEIINLNKEFDSINEKLAETEDYTSDKYIKYINRLEEISHRLEILEAAKYEELVERTLLGLGFLRSDFNRNINEFSGGWKMRVELAKILIAKPEILLLDEPTNHLDIESIRWLEGYLMQYLGIVLTVSHDRLFLDNVCTRTIEITSQKVFDFNGSYSKFSTWRDEMIESQLATQTNQAKEIEHIKKFIERFRYKSSKAKQVQSKIKLLDKLDSVEIEYKDTSSIAFSFPKAPPSGRVVVEANSLAKSYGNLNVFRDLEFAILRGESVAFIGKNGEGKSTLAKIITGNETFDGNLTIGHNVNIGYFAQNQAELLDQNKTVFQTMDDIAVGDARKQTRSILGGFLFKGEDIDKKVSVLSGGEKTRLAIACMLLNPFNLLIMDEPTNHLDMISKDILKHALLHYGGTMIIVSHDRDFLTGLTDRVFDFHNHTIKQYSGGIEEYLERNKLESLDDVSLRRSTISTYKKENKVSDNKISYEERKEIERQKKKLERQIAAYEEQMIKLEEYLKLIEEEMNSGIADESVFMKYGDIKKELDEVTTKWEEIYLKVDS